MSTMRNRRLAPKVIAAPSIRPPLDQLKIIAAAYSNQAAKLEDAAARQRLRSLALASVMLIDGLAA